MTPESIHQVYRASGDTYTTITYMYTALNTYTNSTVGEFRNAIDDPDHWS